MGKTLTITDDDLGARASVRIEHTPAGQPIITELKFEGVAGQGLTAAALGLMEDLGLRLPQQAPAVTRKKPAPGRKPARSRAPAARKPGNTPPAAVTPPPPAQLPERPGGAAEAPALEAAAPPPQPPLARERLADPEPATPPPPVNGHRRTAAAAPQQRRYRTGPPPTVAELTEVYRRHRGDHKAIAEELGCAVSTLSVWLRKAREGGATISLKGLPGHDDGDGGRG
jgi:hypothetical protein